MIAPCHGMSRSRAGNGPRSQLPALGHIGREAHLRAVGQRAGNLAGQGFREPTPLIGKHWMVGSESDSRVIRSSFDEPERFGEIFDRHATVVFRYLVRRVGVDDAEALLGDVFRVAFEKRTTYDDERPSARPWLYGIATNLLAHHRRSEARRIAATARLLAAGQVPPSDSTDQLVARLDALELWPHVAEAVALLPEAERDTLLLYVWEELSYDEIAAALDIPVGTVRSRINRARLGLRELRTSIGRQQ
jgi:RNA polymerase sigma factor (sigma-70 family)